MFKILALSTGSTSTKLGVFEGDRLICSETVRHSAEELSAFASVVEQYVMRKNAIVSALEALGQSLSSFSAAVSVGGPIKPMPGGTYAVNPRLAGDTLSGNVYMQHASLLGALISFEIEKQYGLKALMVDPVTTDEFEPVARVSGHKAVPRTSQAHALNAKAVARRVAKDLGVAFTDAMFVVAHMGGGGSVSAIRNGRIIDSLTSRQDGAFSAEAAGGLPMPDFVDYMFRTKADKKALTSLWFGTGGLVSHLGTNNIQQIQTRIDSGDGEAELVLQGMAYATSKAIGAMAAVLGTAPHAIVLTGGAAYSERIVSWIKSRVGFLAPVHVVPGEDELPALAEAALRVLTGEEEAQEYK